MRKEIVCGLVMCICVLAGAETALAQNAQIVGTIRDQTGGVIPGVSVVARNQETGLSRTAVTDVNGGYRLPALPPGTYELVAELMDFGTESRRDIQLTIDQTATLNVTLRPAGVTEAITVTAESPIVDTTRSEVSTSVTTQQIQALPVAGRRWVDLAMLTPGTSQDSIRGQFYRGNVNIGGGLRSYSNAFVVDGVSNNWAQMGEPRQNFAMDSIREFKVSTSSYKAEHGLATGGVVSVVSKSGTNELRGSSLFFFRNEALTGRTFFETERPDFRRYQWGGSVGGPIIRDRTHFFVAFERTDERQFLTVNTRGVWPEHDGTYLSDQYNWNYTAKIDHQLTSSQSAFLRVSQERDYRPANTIGGRITPSASFDFGVPRTSAVLGHTWVMGSRGLNDFRFQYGFSKYIVAPPYSDGNWKAGHFGEDRLGLCQPTFSYPSVQVGTCNSQMGPETRWQLKNDYSLRRGTHEWKMGIDFSYITFQGDGTGGYAGTWTFPLDRPYDPNDSRTWPTQYSQSLPTFADVPVRHFSAYIQDDWSIANGFVLNLGLRYDLQRGNFNEDIPGLLNRIERVLGPGRGYPMPIPFHEGADRRGDWNNLGPRVGFAWDPTGTGLTNVRAGYGVFYDNLRTLTNFGELTWPQGQPIVIRNPSFPDPLQGRTREEFLSTAPPNITVLSNDMVNPIAHHVSVGVTRVITPSSAVTADFTMVNRYSDRETVDQNLPDPVTRARPYPQFGRVSFGQHTSDDTYRALLLKFEKRMSRNYQFLVSYTLAKAEGTGFTNSLGDSYGYVRVTNPASADRRHRLVASSIVQLPRQFQFSVISDFRTSLTFNPSTSLDLDGDGYGGDLPPGVAPMSGCRGLNVDAISSFRQSRGLSGISASDVSCPGYMNIDVRLSRGFHIGTHRIEAIAQMFNITNRANFDGPISNPLSANFGRVNRIVPYINAPSRQVEFALRYTF
jgi:hypothetical protein